MSESGQLRLHNTSRKGGEHIGQGSLDTINKTTARSFNESIKRDVDQTRHSDTQRLTAAERARLLGDIDTLRNDITATYYDDRRLMKGYAADDRTWATDLQEKMRVNINERLTWAETELDRRIAAQYDTLARIAGSSHNCYTAWFGAATARDAINQRASILADMDIKALNSETTARDMSFKEGAIARLDSNDKEWGHDATQWQLLRDALMTHDETQHTDDDTARTIGETINETTLATKVALTSRGWAEDYADQAGTYAGIADGFANSGFTP